MTKKHGNLYYAIAIGEDEKSLAGLRVPMGSGVAGWVASTGNPLIVPNVSLDPHWSAFARRHPDLNLDSIACVPIRSGEKTLGVIQLLNSKLDLLSEYSISFLRILCDYAAIAIGNARSVDLIHKLSITDDCTGLFNSRHLYTLLDEHVSLRHPATAEFTPFGLVFIDLDHFKTVNDTHGHLVGTRLLAEVGSLIKRICTLANPSFRYGGDEFVILMPGLDKAAATDLTHTLADALRTEAFLTGEQLSLSITGSFGLASFPEDADSVHTILRAADAMMYEVKNTTRDDVAIAARPRALSTLPPSLKSIKPERRTYARR